MQIHTLNTVFKKAGVPLWVCVAEAEDALRLMYYDESVRLELAEWIARRFSLAFRAGQLNAQPTLANVEDIKRMLTKMGYCEPNAIELTDFIVSNMSGLYAKGQSMRNLH